jgi:hypothetical protein
MFTLSFGTLYICISSLLNVATSYHTFGSFSRRSASRMDSKFEESRVTRNSAVPTSSISNEKGWTVQAIKSLSVLTAVAFPLLSATKAKAVGSLFEFKDQNMVIQDISFNVGNTLKDTDALVTLFQNNIRPLRASSENNVNTTVLGFGPDAYIR